MFISEQQTRSPLLVSIVHKVLSIFFDGSAKVEHFNCSSMETTVLNEDVITEVKSSVV